MKELNKGCIMEKSLVLKKDILSAFNELGIKKGKLSKFTHH